MKQPFSDLLIETSLTFLAIFIVVSFYVGLMYLFFGCNPKISDPPVVANTEAFTFCDNGHRYLVYTGSDNIRHVYEVTNEMGECE
jgi:hypothetical protein